MRFATLPFALKYRCNPIYDPINHACDYAVYDDGSGDHEHLSRHAEDQSLCFEFQGRCAYSIGKSGNGNQGSGACKLCDVIIHTQSGQKRRKENQRHADSGCRSFFIQATLGIEIQKQLSQGTYGAAHPKGMKTIPFCWRTWTKLPNPSLIFFFRHIDHPKNRMPLFSKNNSRKRILLLFLCKSLWQQPSEVTRREGGFTQCVGRFRIPDPQGISDLQPKLHGNIVLPAAALPIDSDP